MTLTPNLPPARAGLARRLIAAVTVALCALGTLAAAAPAAASTEPAIVARNGTLTLDGRGWGHGRGLSQWGAQGYAADHGWSTNQILDHYYRGTRSGPTPANAPLNPNAVRVRLMAWNDRPLVVANRPGTTVDGHAAPGAAIRLVHAGNGVIHVQTGPTCTGPFTTHNQLSWPARSTVKVASTSAVELCTGNRYPGTVSAVVHNGAQRAVNTTTVDAYLRGVIPNEVPASWHPAALGVQAVAARSYVTAGDTRHRPYADTCDTTLCQVYKGHGLRRADQTIAATTDPRTDAAITATAGQVRIWTHNGTVARTEFSSSSGGWTTTKEDGNPFGAVEDRGDATRGNSRHTWTMSVPVSKLEARWGAGQRFSSLQVTARNGIGVYGGRVRTAVIRFSGGRSVTVTGNDIRSAAGLHSDWFAAAGTPQHDPAASCTGDPRFVDAAHTLFLGRTATKAEQSAACMLMSRHGHGAVTNMLAVSDEWAGRQIAQLYADILGRPADATGRSYWLAQVARGVRVEDVAAGFYASAEYYRAAGNTRAGFVDALYVDLLDRPADRHGRAYWAGMLDRGVPRLTVAAGFYASVESRRDRVESIYRQVLNRPADAAGRTYWAGQLLTLGDVRLAATLAASPEFVRNAHR